jgi:hypothetical protein
MYNLTQFAVQLNEPENGVAPTDTRNRPDQRLMEEAKWDEANAEKLRLEEKQRTTRKKREAEYALKNPNSESTADFYLNSNNNNENDENDETIMNTMQMIMSAPSHDPEPTWFRKTVDPLTNLPIHVYKNEYWECKDKQEWSRCPDIF